MRARPGARSIGSHGGARARASDAHRTLQGVVGRSGPAPQSPMALMVWVRCWHPVAEVVKRRLRGARLWTPRDFHGAARSFSRTKRKRSLARRHCQNRSSRCTVAVSGSSQRSARARPFKWSCQSMPSIGRGLRSQVVQSQPAVAESSFATGNRCSGTPGRCR